MDKKSVLVAIVLMACACTASAIKEAGGGSTLAGKPIELYRGHVTKYASFERNILPMLEKLDRKVPNFAGDMRTAFTKKLWYFVPTRLDQLPADVTGIQFASDQIIIQLEKSVWVDKTQFDAMMEYEQTVLILHELVLAAVMKNKRDPAFTAKDSDLVRATTIYLLDHPDDPAEVVQENLREIEYFYPTAYEWMTHGKDPVGKLAGFMQDLKKSKDLPNQFMYYGGTYKFLETICVFNFKFNSSTGAFTTAIHYRDLDQRLRTKSEGKPMEVTLYKNKATMSLHSRPFGMGSLPGVGYTFVGGDEGGSDGEVRRTLIIAKSGPGETPSEAHIGFAICRDSLGTGTCRWELPTTTEIEAKGFSSSDVRSCVGKSWSRENLD